MQIEYLSQSLRLTNLTVGESAYIPHENCTTRNKMWVMRKANGYSMYCNKCGYKRFIPSQHRSSLSEVHTKAIEVKTEIKLPDDFTTDTKAFPRVAMGWLMKHYISNFGIETMKIGYSDILERLVLPVYDLSKQLILWQGRSFDDMRSKYHTEKLPNAIASFHWKTASDYSVRTVFNMDWVILTEDILSAMRVSYDTGFTSIALLGTNPHLKPLIPKILGKKLLLWLDPDTAGLSATLKLKRELEFFAQKVVIHLEAKCEPKELSYVDLNIELMRLTENE